MESIRRLLSIFICAFGALTLFMSGSVIFDLFGIRDLEGNYVSFIVWINFLGGFMYFFAGYGLWKNQRWSLRVFGGLIVMLILGYMGLFIHIYNEGLYEEKTVRAMLFRIVLTLVLYVISRFFLSKSNKQ
jgi:hypothetical protein